MVVLPQLWGEDGRRSRGVRNKFHAKKCSYDGMVFDSKRERDRYCELKLLAQAGEISGLAGESGGYAGG